MHTGPSENKKTDSGCGCVLPVSCVLLLLLPLLSGQEQARGGACGGLRPCWRDSDHQGAVKGSHSKRTAGSPSHDSCLLSAPAGLGACRLIAGGWVGGGEPEKCEAPDVSAVMRQRDCAWVWCASKLHTAVCVDVCRVRWLGAA